LHLANCNIGKEGARALAVGIGQMKNLSVLDLNGNKILTDGCIAIMKELKANVSLTELYLNSNFIDVEGSLHVAECLENKKYIAELWLSYNNM